MKIFRVLEILTNLWRGIIKRSRQYGSRLHCLAVWVTQLFPLILQNLTLNKCPWSKKSFVLLSRSFCRRILTFDRRMPKLLTVWVRSFNICQLTIRQAPILQEVFHQSNPVRSPVSCGTVWANPVCSQYKPTRIFSNSQMKPRGHILSHVLTALLSVSAFVTFTRIYSPQTFLRLHKF